MTHIPIHKDPKHALDALWWNPWLLMQWNVNKALESWTAMVVPPALWDTEEGILSDTQNNFHRLFCMVFNNAPYATTWWLGAKHHPDVTIHEDEKQFCVEIPIPEKIKPTQLEVLTEDKALTIENKGRIKNYKRTVALPADADLDRAKTRATKNKIIVLIPKKEDPFHETEEELPLRDKRKAG